MKVVLDARRMQEPETAHAYLKEQLNLPDYYGNNLDALYDCLTEMPEEEIAEISFENESESGEYFWKIYRVFQMARI